MKIMLKEAFILFAITLIAGLMLGVVYDLTKDTISEREALARMEACKAVFEDAKDFQSIEYVLSSDLVNELALNGVKIGTIYNALDSSGNILGYVIEAASSEGYGGTIGMYLGVRNDGTLNGISIIEISETVGLGMEAENVLVPQFNNKKISQFSYTKSGSTSDDQIDAISGATITTKAVVNAVNGGLRAASELANSSNGGAV